MEDKVHQLIITICSGPSCSKPDWANPGIVEILIVIELPLNGHFLQD